MVNFRMTEQQTQDHKATVCCITFENHNGPKINRLNRILAYRYNLDAKMGVGGDREWVRRFMLRNVVTAIHNCKDCSQYTANVVRLAADIYVDNFLIECDLGNWDE